MSGLPPIADSRTERHSRSSVLRRVVMPLLVVIVAGVILFWGWRSEESDLREVEDAVRLMTQEIYYAPTDGPLPARARQMGVTYAIADLMQRILTDSDWDQVRIEVHTGDTPPPYGDGRATHHAIIYVRNQPRLGLRLAHLGVADQIEVLGYWAADVVDMP